MSYGHFIVLPNQNRDMVQIISVQDKAALKEYKAWETTRHNKISDGYHGSTCTTTLLALNVHDMTSQLYTQLKLKSTKLFIRENLLKKHV